MAKTEGNLTLEELKAENAAIEEKSNPAPQADDDKPEIDAVDEDLEVNPEDAESSDDKAKETDTEDWMKADGHTSEAEKKFTDGDIGKAKAKLRAKLERKNDENEQLKARVAELEKPSVNTSELNRPKREDFFDSDDPEEAYEDAFSDYAISKNDAKRDAKNVSSTEQARQQQINLETNQAVDQHYERAAELTEASGIAAEAYQGADYRVRQMVESVFPESGDLITDAFISKLGKGSEKVMYSLGISDVKRETFKKLLLDDTSGIAAGMYLGELKKSLNAPSKKTTLAPDPGAELKGDEKPQASDSAMQKQYDKAHKGNNFQKAFKLKQSAKSNGVDTSNW